MKLKKVLFLFLALLLPISIFIFLKLFGKNEFNVPLLYQEGKIDRPGCNYTYKMPYTLPDSVTSAFELDDNQLTLLIFNDGASLNIIRENYGNDVKMINVPDLKRSDAYVSLLMNCVLLTEAPYDLVLIDDKSRIRGYYESEDRDEIDRLEVEIKIILKQY